MSMWGNKSPSKCSLLTPTCLLISPVRKNLNEHFIPTTLYQKGRDCSVGMAIRYGLDDRRSNLRRSEIFRSRTERLWGPPNLLYNGYWVSFPGVKRLARCVNHTPHLASRLRKDWSYTSTPPRTFIAGYWAKFYTTLDTPHVLFEIISSYLEHTLYKE
jgi:hypothetical protein